MTVTKDDNGQIHNQHDVGYKYLLSHKKTFIELLKSFVKEKWVEDIEDTNIVLVSKSYILQDFKEKESDIVYKVKLKEKDIIFYCLLELQSTVDYEMPIRLLFYMTEIWRDILKNVNDRERKKENFRLPAIVPLILYNGENQWTACRSFKEILDGYELFEDCILDFNYTLFDVNRYKEEELLKLANLISTIFLLDQKVNMPVIKERLQKTANILKLSDEQFTLFKNWVKRIFKPRMTQPIQEELEMILDKASAMEVKEMVSNLALTLEKELSEAQHRGKQEGREEGIKEGIKEGREAGKKEGKKEVAKSMLVNGMDIDLIIRLTGLSREVVEEMKKDIIH